MSLRDKVVRDGPSQISLNNSQNPVRAYIWPDSESLAAGRTAREVAYADK